MVYKVFYFFRSTPEGMPEDSNSIWSPVAMGSAYCHKGQARNGLYHTSKRQSDGEYKHLAIKAGLAERFII